MKPSRLFSKVCCGVILLSFPAFGFEFRRSAETLEEVGTIVMCILDDPKGSYVFQQPYNWDAQYDEQSKVVTLAPKKNPQSWITVKLAPSTNSPQAGIRAYVGSAFQKAEFGEQFTLHTANQEAEAADFTDASAGPVPLKRRVVLVKSPSGTFEVLLSSRADAFGAGEGVFGQLLTSFDFRAPGAKPGATATQ